MSGGSPPAATLREAPRAGGGDGVPRLELRDWADRFGLTAGITTAKDGFSLGLALRDPQVVVMDRWRAFQAALRPGFSRVVVSRQVHGTRVAWHEGVPDGLLVLDGVDGHATAERGVLLAVTVADCTPVYLAAPGRGAVALVHAGWRGAADGILERGVALLQARCGCVSRDVVMHCGIAICGNCYEVGSEVAERFGIPAPGGKAQLDVRAELVRQAERLGVGEITVSPWCVAHGGGEFHSHRASRGAAGRMLAYLGMPST